MKALGAMNRPGGNCRQGLGLNRRTSRRAQGGIKLLLALALGLIFRLNGPAQGVPPENAPIYRLDLSRLAKSDLNVPVSARRAWDELHLAASIQGIVNRDGANLFLRFMPETDDFWWDYLRNEQGWLKHRPVVEVSGVAELVQRFAPKLKGVVLYDEKVAATANLASTIAGVEGTGINHRRWHGEKSGLPFVLPG